MKIILPKQSREQGSVLLITITFGVILLLVLASYLMLLTGQKSVVTRSQTWNDSMTMAEAGIEEGLAQVNASNAVFNFGVNVFTNFSINGWGGGGGSVFGPKSRSLLGGTYSVIISNNMPPTIYSTGYTTVPIVGGTISRRVSITTSQEPLINVGLGAISSIQFNGNGVATDSYDSTKNSLSTFGQYDPTKTSTNGNVASVGGLVNLGNHSIDGELFLGPTATYGGGGTITGGIDYNYNVQFPDVTLPPGASSWATATTTSLSTTNNKGKVSTTTVYDFTNTNGPQNYILTSDAYPIYVEAGVTVNLNVTSTTFSPSDLELRSIYTNSSGSIATNSGTAILYINGATSVGIAGNSDVNAGIGSLPANLWYFGLSTLTSITFSGTSMFIGVIYAPEASLTLNGGGNNLGVQGSAIVHDVTMNGHYDFHYDQSLAVYGPNRGYIATSWQEY